MDADSADDLVHAGREALAAADWARAGECFERARDVEESAEVLAGLSEAVHFQGEYDRAIELKERAFALYRRRGSRVEAAELARWLAFLHGAVHGNMAAANGWMARAASLLEDVEECAAHGWLALDRAPWTSVPSEREELARTALDIARRFDDADLEFGALALLGDAYVHGGRVDEGMTLLDEAMAAVTGGEVVGVATVGEIYCRLLGACERAADVRRAEQWMAVAADYVVWGDFVPPTCRLHYGGILIANGRWGEAEAELLAAIRTFEAGYRAMRRSPLLRLAELRVLQGRFEEAERLQEGSESHPVARRLRATVALARGDLALAEELVRMALELSDLSDPESAPLLELLVDVQLARGDPRAAAETLDRLSRLGDHDRVSASVEFAAGRILAAEGDEQAVRRLHAAVERFTALELPLAAAHAQLELAAALAAGAPGAAVAEARLALATFERLGAVGDADAAGDLLRRLGGPGRTWPPKGHGALTKRETEVLSLLAAGCSNAEIGERLYISRRTAEHHVASIRSKLGLRSRAEAAAYAVRHSESP
ncbi:MAG TPA: LuxR C-terminal-related transcriptional regulator [Solirubrobacteraceae bacterium]|nr:LuxR C-terminal-related transcriptional regulator [Solirubrobacteraceae bacterium]